VVRKPIAKALGVVGADVEPLFEGAIVLAGVGFSDLRVTASIRTDLMEYLSEILAQFISAVVRKSGARAIVLSPPG